MQQSQRLAYSYIRMSTEKQNKGDSLRRQLVWSESFSQRHNLALQDVTAFADIGVSAWKGLNRSKGKLGAFIDLVNNGNIPSNSYLLVENLDRLSRMTPLEALDLFKEILKTGITVVAKSEYGDEEIYTWKSLNADANQLMSTITTMLRANRESERKSQIIKDAFARKRELSRQGVKTNQVPPTWITAKKIGRGIFEYELNEKAEIVREIFEMSAKGIGFHIIAREMNQRGVPTLKPGKKGWWYSGVAFIVRNRSAIGEYQAYEQVDGERIPRGDPIPDYYPAVVSNDLFLKAQKLRLRNRKGGRAGTIFTNLLNGLCECVHCRSPMHLINKTRSNKAWSYYACSAHYRGLTRTEEIDGVPTVVPICTVGTARYNFKKVEANILRHVNDFGVSDLMQIRRMDENIQSLDEQIADLSVSLESLRKREERLSMVLESEDADDLPELLVRLRERTRERKDTEQKLEDAQNQREIALAKQKGLDPASAIKQLQEAWETAQGDGDLTAGYSYRARCNAAMKEIIDRVEFDSVEHTYTVIIYGGMRAYKFVERKWLRGPDDQVPQVVDAIRFMADNPMAPYKDTIGANTTPQMDETAIQVERGRKVTPKQTEIANDVDVNARNEIYGSGE